MRAVRLTKAEVALIRDRFVGNLTPKERKTAEGLMAKLSGAEGPAPVGASVAPIEAALVAAGRGKVVRLDGGSGYARASRLAAAAGATVEQAATIGGWLGRQGWFTGPVTVLGVLGKWADYLARARATAPAPAAKEGFDGKADVAPGGDAGPGGRDPGRKAPEGFG